MHFTLVITNITIGVTMTFVYVVDRFHTIPDVHLIDLNMAEELAQVYLEANKEAENSDTDDDGNNTLIPSLNGASNWDDFREKVKIKLLHMKNVPEFNLSYLIDSTPRLVSNENNEYLQVQSSDAQDPIAFQKGVYFLDQTISHIIRIHGPCWNQT